jgi:hypothetical protein
VELRETPITAGGETVTASILRMGNPQCVVLGPLPDAQRFERLGPALSTHSMFPQGTNVEFAQVEARDRVRIMIWERGVGPTLVIGNRIVASAVAAAAHGGAPRAVDVIAPGGTQRVEWQDDGVYLTGWAEVVFDGQWLWYAASLASVTLRFSLLLTFRRLRGGRWAGGALICRIFSLCPPVCAGRSRSPRPEWPCPLFAPLLRRA